MCVYVRVCVCVWIGVLFVCCALRFQVDGNECTFTLPGTLGNE